MLPVYTLEILKNLSKADIKKLGSFIDSPYFNSKKTLSLLFTEIEKQYPAFEPSKFDFKKIYKKIFGQSEYREQTIRNLYSDFGNILRDFIAHEKFRSDKPAYNLAVARGLSEKKCYEQSAKYIDSHKNETGILGDKLYFLNKFLIEEMNEKNLLAKNRFDIDKYHANYNTQIEYLIFFFVESFYVLSHNDQYITKAHKAKKDHSGIRKSFRDSLNMEKFLSENNSLPVTVKLSYLFCRYSDEGLTGVQYEELEKMVLENIDKFEFHFKIYCWSILLDVLSYHLIPKDRKFYKTAFSLNERFDKLDLYSGISETRTFPVIIFKLSFLTAVIMKEFEWAKKFIEKYSGLLYEPDRENERNYSLARLSLQSKDHERSLEYLSKVDYKTVLDKMNVKFNYLMNYIELKSYQSAISMLNSIRQFYSESKELPEEFGRLIEVSLKYFREIIRCEENNKKLDYALYKEAQNAGRYYQKQYILEKMEKIV